jgi:hypothetical protein
MKKKRLLTDRSGELQEQIIAEKAKELAYEIDAQLMRSMYQQLGWHEVVLQPMDWEQSYHIDTWVESNVKGSIWTHGLVWMFEKDQDAMWFKLRWL